MSGSVVNDLHSCSFNRLFETSLYADFRMKRAIAKLTRVRRSVACRLRLGDRWLTWFSDLGWSFLGITEAGTLQHSTQVNHLLSVLMRLWLGRLKGLRLVPEGYEESPVVGLFDLCHRLKQK